VCRGSRRESQWTTHGSLNTPLPQPSEATALSFEWRAGKERTTTGIWMWSEPFIRRAANGEDVAVLVMDTQVRRHPTRLGHLRVWGATEGCTPRVRACRACSTTRRA
jgi:hypothetical protein